jgi:hypothetical protein
MLPLKQGSDTDMSRMPPGACGWLHAARASRAAATLTASQLGSQPVHYPPYISTASIDGCCCAAGVALPSASLRSSALHSSVLKKATSAPWLMARHPPYIATTLIGCCCCCLPRPRPPRCLRTSSRSRPAGTLKGGGGEVKLGGMADGERAGAGGGGGGPASPNQANPTNTAPQ